MFNTIKVKVKLSDNCSCYNDTITGFAINKNEEKETELTSNIRNAIKDGILIKINEK